MKSVILLFVSSLILTVASAQQPYLDSLKQRLNLAKNQDTARVLALFSLADYYGFIQEDSCLFYAAKIAHISEKLNYPYGKFLGYWSAFHGLNCQANYTMALDAALNMQKKAEELKNEKPWLLSEASYFLGVLYVETGDYSNAVTQFRHEIQSWGEIGESMPEAYFAFSQTGVAYLKMKQLDSALWYAQKGYELGLQSKKFKIYFPLAIGVLGNVYMALRQYKLAENYFKDAIVESGKSDNLYFDVRNYNNLAILYDKMNLKDSCIHYATLSLQVCQKQNFIEFTLEVSKILTKVYESEGRKDSTIKYMRIMIAANDSAFSLSKGRQFQQAVFQDIQRQQQINASNERYRNQVRTDVMLASLGVFLLLTFVLYRNARVKQKANHKIEKAYAELKSTQSQLIQSEKMASLGELTAGIAHEIENPLNFVNNFSEINDELISDLQGELRAGNAQEALEISTAIQENEKKIIQHGKRADAIVKGMLLHSRTGAGEKVLADINAILDECLKLSYHNMRAKDKSFDAQLHTDFDQSIGKFQFVPQDMVRVFINLFNNAFYAVGEKTKQQLNGYVAEVSVITKKTDHSALVTIKDNGVGIPDKIKEKIFQPFFTTKPTGQGTGLGLSLSYDIVKAHGGEIKVETKEGDGSEFSITLPKN